MFTLFINKNNELSISPYRRICINIFVRWASLPLISRLCLILKFIITLEVELMKTLFVLYYQRYKLWMVWKCLEGGINKHIKRVSVTGPVSDSIAATLLRPAARYDYGKSVYELRSNLSLVGGAWGWWDDCCWWEWRWTRVDVQIGVVTNSSWEDFLLQLKFNGNSIWSQAINILLAQPWRWNRRTLCVNIYHKTFIGRWMLTTVIVSNIWLWIMSATNGTNALNSLRSKLSIPFCYASNEMKNFGTLIKEISFSDKRKFALFMFSSSEKVSFWLEMEKRKSQTLPLSTTCTMELSFIVLPAGGRDVSRISFSNFDLKGFTRKAIFQ